MQESETMEANLISVIVPVYNVEAYIAKCLNSLLSQSYSEYEIITVDDGSTDSSGAICDDYSQKFERVVSLHKKNGGLSDARNYGLEHAKGGFIMFVDSDDYVDSDCLEYLYSLLKKYKTRLSMCQLRVVLENGRTIDHGVEGDELLTGKKCLERMLYHDMVDTTACAKLYDVSLFDDVRYPQGKQFEDIGTTYKFFLKCNDVAMGYASKYNYIFRSSSIVNCDFNPKKFDLLDMTDNMGAEVLKEYPDLSKAVMRRRVYSRFSTLNQMLCTDQFPDKKKELIRFINTNGALVIKDQLVPKRDKLAIILLRMSFGLYRFVWLLVGKK